MNRATTVYTIGHPVVLAHRGGGGEVPENTLEGVEKMLHLGVEVMETDVRHTSDGVAVLAHDVTLARRFGDPRGVSDVTWEELRELRDVDGAAPASLAGVLAAFPGLVLNIDAKTDEVVAPMLRDVRAANAADRVCLTAFSARRVAQIARITRGRTMIGMGMADVARLLAWANLPVRPAVLPPGFRRAQGSRAVQVPQYFRGLPVVTPRFVQAAHDAGHVVHVWTVDEPEEMHRLLDLGVDGIVTDLPSVAVAVFGERGLAPA